MFKVWSREKIIRLLENRNEYKTGLHLMSWCRDCHNKLCIIYRKKNIDKMRKWQNEYYKTRKIKDKEKLLARYLTREAIRKNEIQKKPCEVCKSVDAQAHHKDYSKPLRFSGFAENIISKNIKCIIHSESLLTLTTLPPPYLIIKFK